MSIRGKAAYMSIREVRIGKVRIGEHVLEEIRSEIRGDYVRD